MKAKKVFVLKNLKSPYIEQAIFILREDAPPCEAMPDAVSEAENIINGYVKNPPKKKRRGLALRLFLALSSVGMLVLCFFTLLRNLVL